MTHLVFLFVIACAIPYSKRRTPFIFFTILSLFLFLALRYDYGNDYMRYLEIHSDLNSGLSSHGGNDLLFYYFNILMPNFFVFVTLHSAIYIYCVSFLIFSGLPSHNVWLGFLLLLINPYLFLVHLSALRQTLAICAFILSIHFLIKKKRLLSIFLILIAAGFHKSALILLPVPFFLNDRKFRLRHFCLIFFSLFSLLFTPLFENLLLSFFNWFPQFRVYSHYVEQEMGNSVRATMLTFLFFLFVLLNINSLRGREIILAKLSLIAYYISTIAYKVSMVNRIGMYFQIFSIVVLPMIFLRNRNSIICKIASSVLLLIYLLRYFSFFNNPIWQGAYHQYKSVFNLLF